MVSTIDTNILYIITRIKVNKNHLCGPVYLIFIMDGVWYIFFLILTVTSIKSTLVKNLDKDYDESDISKSSEYNCEESDESDKDFSMADYEEDIKVLEMTYDVENPFLSGKLFMGAPMQDPNSLKTYNNIDDETYYFRPIIASDDDDDDDEAEADYSGDLVHSDTDRNLNVQRVDSTESSSEEFISNGEQFLNKHDYKKISGVDKKKVLVKPLPQLIEVSTDVKKKMGLRQKRGILPFLNLRNQIGDRKTTGVYYEEDENSGFGKVKDKGAVNANAHGKSSGR